MPRSTPATRTTLSPTVLPLYGIAVPAADYHTLCRLAAIFYGKTYAAAMSETAAQESSARYALEVLEEWRRRQQVLLQELLGPRKGDPK